MVKAFFYSRWVVFLLPIAFVLLLFPSLAQAQVSPMFTELDFELGVEIGNEKKDFADAGLTVEKGRFLTYQIKFRNNGSYTMNHLRILMEPPDYMQYVPESTFMTDNTQVAQTHLPDVKEGMSPLALGYELDMLPPQRIVEITVQYQVLLEIPDDPAYSLAWAHAWDLYSIIPVVTDPVETVISGEPVSSIQVEIVPSPEEGQPVNSGFFIEYLYKFHNVSGLTIDEVNLATFLPDYANCIEGCEAHHIGTLEPNQQAETVMVVQVAQDTQGASYIAHAGYDLFGQNMETVEYREDLLHPLDDVLVDEGDFIVTIDQVPDLILNSHDEQNLREDEANQTETMYLLDYEGRHRTYTYPAITPGNKQVAYDCKVYEHPYPPNAQFYAYNSQGGGCEHLNECPINSSSVIFNVTTDLPEAAPRLLFEGDTTTQQKQFPYSGKSGKVNNFIKNGEVFSLPEGFTLSRAAQNGLVGLVYSLVSATVNEDLWQYKKTGQKESIGQCSCGEDCSYTVYRDIYHWQRVNQTPFELKDEDETDISVYTSTAWLKTQGGHIGTNSWFAHGADTLANYVPLGINPVEVQSHLTPSEVYTPPGEANADYMVFASQDIGALEQAHNDADWVQTGVEFPFLQQGDPYDQEIHPRNYTQDLLERQLYAPVEKETLNSPLLGTVELGDNVVIHHEGDLVIGEEGSPDPVFFNAGQVRLYVEGDVYIYTDVFYDSEGITGYAQMPSVRIDAATIYVDGAVENLELMLLARENFYSGESHRQLNILGDVMAKNTVWERKPLLQFEPTKFNEPSEYVIEDLRKYVIPVPGDTQLPNDHTIWRQVNPATGEVWDTY